MTKYFIEGLEVSEEKFDAELECAMYRECDDEKYATYLDDSFYCGEIVIDGFTFSPSSVLWNDQESWAEGRLSFVEDELDRAKDELDYSGEIFVNGKSFEIKASDDAE